jgi:hypothetical protein
MKDGGASVKRIMADQGKVKREQRILWSAELSPTKEQDHITINDEEQCTTLETNDTTPQYTIHFPSSCTDKSHGNISCLILSGFLSTLSAPKWHESFGAQTSNDEKLLILASWNLI